GERLGDRRVADAGGARGRSGGGGVLSIVCTRDPRLRRQRILRAEFDPVEPQAWRHDRRPCALEDAELRVAIRLEGAVAVEMVGLEVEENGDVAGERVHVLELKARELAHHGGTLLDLEGDVGQRSADVSRY